MSNVQFTEMECEHEEWSIFYELPLELHPLLVAQMDLVTLNRALCVCKLWASLASDNLYKNICIEQFRYKELFKPVDRSWKWVIMSKQTNPDLNDETVAPPPPANGEAEKAITGPLFSGLGPRTFPHGMYEGEWTNGKRGGTGVFYWSDIEKYDVVYIGEWKDDTRTGKGECIWNTGDRYTGDWVDEKATGQGSFCWASGSQYTGAWFDGKQHGSGTFKWKHGDSYEGDWVEGKQTGKGTFRWVKREESQQDGKEIVSVGDTYEGDWVDNKKQGSGVFQWENGDTYEGQWQEDKKTGVGKFTWANGDLYDGGWEWNKKHGKGVYAWVNGDRFEGEWNKGKQTGFGVNTWANENVFEGLWEDGEKRDGDFYEAATDRKFHSACATRAIDMSLMHPDLQEAVANKQCTYGVTGPNCYFQYLWETRENVDRTHGVCYACKEHCVPKNKITLMESKKFHFGGNFFCDCGSGNLENPCSLRHNHPAEKMDCSK